MKPEARTFPISNCRSVLLLTLALLAPLSVGTSRGAASKAAATWTDANIAAVVLAANTVDIQNGKLALSRSKSQPVKEFAQLMVKDHSSVNAKATALAGRLKLVPVKNAACRSLVSDADKTRAKLRRLSGAKFDRAYVDNEVAMHEAVIGMLDSTLVPAAQNKELKDLLVSVRPAFVAHLEHAKMVQSSLSK